MNASTAHAWVEIQHLHSEIMVLHLILTHTANTLKLIYYKLAPNTVGTVASQQAGPRLDCKA